MAKPIGNHIHDTPFISNECVLRQAADAKPRLAPHQPFLRHEITANDLKQGGLTRAVTADHAHPLPRFDATTGLIKKGKMAESHRNTVERDERHPKSIVPSGYARFRFKTPFT